MTGWRRVFVICVLGGFVVMMTVAGFIIGQALGWALGQVIGQLIWDAVHAGGCAC